MHEVALLDEMIAMLVGAVVAAGFPPVSSGAFWAMVALYWVVSVLFDDETPRGIPGLEYIQARRPNLFKSEQ
ncbi:MAG TPA: hypothetical protein VIX59_14605 [Candidatus Binataceae bacterium]